MGWVCTYTNPLTADIRLPTLGATAYVQYMRGPCSGVLTEVVGSGDVRRYIPSAYAPQLLSSVEFIRRCPFAMAFCCPMHKLSIWKAHGQLNLRGGIHPGFGFGIGPHQSQPAPRICCADAYRDDTPTSWGSWHWLRRGCRSLP
jgi:hypothetical protein